MTPARLTRLDGAYRLPLALGEFENYDEATTSALEARPTPEWPHAFARLDVPAETFLSRFGANHIHAVPGDRRPELKEVGELLGITLDEFTRG